MDNKIQNLKKQIEKVFMNADYKAYTPNVYHYFSPKKAEEVTKMGKKAFEEMMKKFSLPQ